MKCLFCCEDYKKDLYPCRMQHGTAYTVDEIQVINGFMFFAVFYEGSVVDTYSKLLNTHFLYRKTMVIRYVLQTRKRLAYEREKGYL
jgi:hypothetical protein